MLIGVDGNEANVDKRVGSGQYSFELLRQFYLDKKNQYSVYLKNSPVHLFPVRGNFVYKVLRPSKLWTQFALSINLTFGKKPDVFFSTAHYGPRFSSVPYVVTIHDLSYIHFPALFKKSDLLQLTSWSSYSIKNSAAIIAPSQSTKDDIIKNYSTLPSKITVIYEGYDRARFKMYSRAQITKTLAKYEIDGDYLIFVGTLQPRKNLERLIGAFGRVHAKQKNLKLVIAGKAGWLYDSILGKAKKLGIDGNVIFLDFVPSDDLPLLVSGAKVYVNPSLWEGFGIPVIEAQACGVPVIVSNVSSLPEIVGDSGILFDPQSEQEIADAIAVLLNNEKLRNLYIKKGFLNIGRFSWEKCAKETISVLLKVASGRNPIV